jgi:hypothetical protein
MAIATVKNETHLLIIEDDQGRKEFILENLVYSASCKLVNLNLKGFLLVLSFK